MYKKITNTIYQCLNSKKFFYIILILFAVQAVWFAITALYPMAFDENYHFGIIKIYAQQWLPFITHTPANSAAFGDVTRYDSYMYHYLMSFPYRFIALFTHQQSTQIILLRFINIGLFIGGIALFHRLLQRVHISRAIANTIFLLFILIPVVPFLAATINYDNLIFLMVPIISGLALTVASAIRSSHQIPASSLILLFVAGGLASLVKYAFLPMFVGALLYLGILVIRTPDKKSLFISIVDTFKRYRLSFRIVLLFVLIIAAGLVGERYGVNVVKYHSIEPDCAKVQSLASCLQYGPWARNYNDVQKVLTTNVAFDPPVSLYIPVWVGGMILRLFFAINYTYSNYDPLPIPIAIGSFVGGLGLILIAIFRKSILKVDKNLLLFGAIILMYVGGLFYVNFTEFLKFRTPVAINGRYLIVILPLLFAWMALAYKQLFQYFFKARAHSFLATYAIVVLLLMLQGGGALTYLVQSNSSWYWQDKTLITANAEAKKLIAPLIVGGRNH